MAITAKQKIFIEYYLANGCNATDAARKAGYKDPEQAGYENKRKQEIQAAIRQRLSEKTMGADEALARLTDQARGSIAPFLRFTPGFPATLDLKSDEAKKHLHLIKKYTVGKDNTVGIELYDAQSALALLGKHYGLLTDKSEQSGTITVRIIDETHTDATDD